jgi:heavy metal sensor kinase
MSLSITQRLTLTYALLTALVLMPAAAALFVAVSSGIEKDGLKRAETNAVRLVRGIVEQLDDDVLLHFGGQSLGFEGLRVAEPHWALLRGDKSTVHAVGALAGRTLDSPREESRDRVFEDRGTPLQVAFQPLLRAVSPSFPALPEAARKRMHEVLPGALPLSTRRAVSGAHDIFEVKMLAPPYVYEAEITAEGRILEGEKVELPKSLPAGLAAALASTEGEFAVKALSWTAHEGQLIAIVDGQGADDGAVRLAVNRLGERFTLADDGSVSGPTADSRLWAAVATDISQEASRQRALLLVLGPGGLLIWLAVVLIGWYTARRAMAPVDRMVGAAKRIELSSLDERLPTGDVNDELHRIAVTINGMLDRIERGYRRESEFTGDASHELRGPLTKIRSEIDVTLAKERTPEEYRDTLLRIKSHGEGMLRLVESLLLLARLDGSGRRLKLEPFDLVDTAVGVVKSLPAADAARVDFRCGESAGPLEVLGQDTLFATLLHNLIENALRYSPAEKRVQVRIRAENGSVHIEVEDEGPGIPREDRERVFQRFYRVDKSRSRASGGFGLGLAIVRAIALAHGIRVEITSAGHGGTLANLDLSVVRRGPEGLAAAAAAGLGGS